MCFPCRKNSETIHEIRRVETLDWERESFMIITSHSVDEESRKNIRVFYNPEVIHLNPVRVFSDGKEMFDIASVKKDTIKKILEISERDYNLKMDKFEERKF